MKKNLRGSVTLWVIIGVVIVAFVGLIIYAYNEKKTVSDGISAYDKFSIVEANDFDGHYGDNILGPKDAKLVIYEYADYQCPACATTFPFLSEVVEEYKGEVALVFRTFVMSYHQNGTAAASAANAAAKQGVWHDYALKLFEKQNEWEYASADSRTEYFINYFKSVAGEKADIDKFTSDMNSNENKTKVSFDAAMAKKTEISATPTIYINGESVKFETVKKDDFKQLIRDKIDEVLKK